MARFLAIFEFEGSDQGVRDDEREARAFEAALQKGYEFFRGRVGVVHFEHLPGDQTFEVINLLAKRKQKGGAS